jgi:prevent-host-death family protein
MPVRSKIMLSTAAVRDNLADAINRAAYGKERVVLTRRGKPMVAIVPVEDVARLEAVEDAEDVAEIRRRTKEWERKGRPTISLEEVARKHGVDLDREDD